MRRWGPGLLLATLGACVFSPDLSRFAPCNPGACPAGSTCLEAEGVCLPDCGAQGPCAADMPPPRDGGTETATDGGPERLVLAPADLVFGVETRVYTPQALTARGGTPPYTYAVTRGPLPPGLALDAGGGLSGTPVQAGSFSFRVEAADAAGQHASQDFSVSVRAVLRLAGPFILADFPSGKPYADTLSATGGMPPWHFVREPGEVLPAGLVLHEDSGKVDGTASASASFSFKVRVTDSATPPQSEVRTLQITPSACTLNILCPRTRAVPEGRVGTDYAHGLQGSGGAGPLTWSVDASSGPLPPGLSLDAASGTVSGRPTLAGRFDVTFQLADALDRKTVAVSFRIF